MYNLLPYEQHIKKQGSNMPVPDMDMAWHEMELLLDKEGDDDVIIPWYKRIGCMLPALLIFTGLLIGSIFYFANKKESKINDEKVSVKNNEKDSDLINEKQNDTTKNIKTDTAKLIVNNDIVAKENNVQESTELLFEQKNKNINAKGKTKTTITGAEIEEENILTNNTKLIITKSKVENKLELAKVNRFENLQKQKEKIISGTNKNVSEENIKKNNRQIKSKAKSKTKTINATPENENIKEEVPSIKPQEEPAAKSSKKNNNKEIIILKAKDTAKTAFEPIAKKVEIVKPNDSTKNKTLKNNVPKKRNKYFLSTGLSILQQLPLNGAKATSLDYLGRSSSLRDYLPAPYIRLTKDKRFYIQGEFRYGVPQYNKPFVYLFEKKTDTAVAGVFTPDSSYSLKKNFYHQVPISFHYYITPSLSIGTGIVYNKFFGVIAEQEISTRRLFLTDTITGKNILSFKDSPDSAFTKNIYEILFEVQYKYRRFEIGGRYAGGLNPYINYINPATKLEEKKYNENFNFYLRYELWSSKKRKK